jgi:hypothetical protein
MEVPRHVAEVPVSERLGLEMPSSRGESVF